MDTFAVFFDTTEFYLIYSWYNKICEYCLLQIALSMLFSFFLILVHRSLLPVSLVLNSFHDRCAVMMESAIKVLSQVEVFCYVQATYQGANQFK